MRLLFLLCLQPSSRPDQRSFLSRNNAGSAFSTLPLLDISAGEAHAQVKRSPIQNLLSFAARSSDRLRNAPYELWVLLSSQSDLHSRILTTFHF